MTNFGTARNESLWQPEPIQRGTYSVISECLITLVLCIWAALHLNIPEQSRKAAQIRRKLTWLVAGVFIPELIVWTAWDQTREARALHIEVKKALGQSEGPRFTERIKSWAQHIVSEVGFGDKDNSEKAVDDNHPGARPFRAHQWTVTHSFFASMGGFVFDADAFRQKTLPGCRKRATLSAVAVARLAVVAPHLLPDISADIIKDKSKSNGLAQAVVALQAVWFLAQCISGMATGVGISLLELTTLIHCICAIAAYLLWWNKPLDIQEPMFIHGHDADTICAGLFLKSSLGNKYVAEGFFRGQHIVAQLCHEDDEEGEALDTDIGLMENLTVGIQAIPARPNFVDIGEPETTGTADEIIPLYMGQSLFGFGFRRCSPGTGERNKGFLATLGLGRATSKEVGAAGLLGLRRPFIRFESGDIHWLRLAQQCYLKYPDLILRRNDIDQSSQLPQRYSQVHEYVVPRSANWAPTFTKSSLAVSSYESLFSKTTLPNIIVLSLLGAIYGGLHLLAWDPPIASESERIMWRASGVVVSLWFPVLALLFFPLALITSSYAERRSGSARDWTVKSINVKPAVLLTGLRWFIWTVLICGWLFAAAARVYIPVQSVVGVSKLPKGVFETAVWARYFPHLS